MIIFFNIYSAIILLFVTPAVTGCTTETDMNILTPTSNFVNQVVLTSNANGTITISGLTDPVHPTGNFPNANNPTAISTTNSFSYTITNNPSTNVYPTAVAEDFSFALLGSNYTGSAINWVFGIALNGIIFDTPANAYAGGDPSGNGGNHRWRYEVVNTNSLVDLGTDFNDAHVQPDGTYHYHGYPSALLSNYFTSETRDEHSRMIGYAADGFPIYHKFGYSNAMDSNSGIVELTPSYRLKSGNRDLSGSDKIDYDTGSRIIAPNYNPSNHYDGTYVRDYEYVSNIGHLDECNGRYGVTPEYPSGTYYYVITPSFPFSPRFFRGTPHSSFAKGSPR